MVAKWNLVMVVVVGEVEKLIGCVVVYCED
jgi:hypothetical protein